MAPVFRRVYRRIRFGEAIVVVSGLPRSGTSLAMKMLAEGGFDLVSDGIRSADESNPEGYYELECVKELDKGGDQSWLGDTRGKAVKIISYLLPYLPDTLNYRVVFMHRDLREVLASQHKMLVSRSESTDTEDGGMLAVFEKHLKTIRHSLAARACFEVIEINYGDVLDHPRQQATRISDFLGGGLDVERMAAAVDERLYRNRTDSSREPRP